MCRLGVGVGVCVSVLPPSGERAPVVAERAECRAGSEQTSDRDFFDGKLSKQLLQASDPNIS